MTIEILTPPGRIVWGHPMERQTKTDPRTRKPILGKDGQEQDVWSFGLAIPVADWPVVEQAIAQAAYQQYPQGNFPRDFAWKIKRETDLDEDNKPYGEREGYAGHVVVSCSTQAFCPPVYKFENGQYRQLTEQEIKCGDWVVAKLNINGHTGGVYVNPNMLQLVGYDKEIQRRSGGNPNETFGGRTYQLPPGVSTTPVNSAPSNVGVPQAPIAPAYAAPQPMTVPAPVQPQYQAPAAPAAPTYPAPAHDFVQNAGQPQQQYQPPAAPIAPVHTAPQPLAAPVAPGYPAAPNGMVGIPTGR